MQKIIKKDLFTIIIDENNKQHIPLFCDVCELPMIFGKDDLSYLEFNCCYYCSTTSAYLDKESWQSGNRPTNEEINKEKEIRTRISNNFFI